MLAQDSKLLFNIVLVEPEIPPNTGNIGRLCVGFQSRLNLIGPMGFDLSEKQLKRAGLDYWPHLSHKYYSNFEMWRGEQLSLERTFFLSKKATREIYDCRFQPGDTFVFGKETKGLKNSVLEEFSASLVKIPMLGPVRSFNLANSVAMVLSEGYRQIRED